MTYRPSFPRHNKAESLERAKVLVSVPHSIIVGTRGSLLARTQTESIVRQIRSLFPEMEVATLVISTDGDRSQHVPISVLGDKGIFVRSLESALLAGEIDLAVHSLKDVPSDVIAAGLKLAAFSPRADPRDALISRGGCQLDELPPGSVVGTSSLRRRVQLAACRDDVQATDIRGNVDTRLVKLHEGEYDALILAAAGLVRLGREDEITQFLAPSAFTPDAGQGILVVQTREEDALDALTELLDDQFSRLVAGAERACVRALGADCRSPVGAYAIAAGDELVVSGMAAKEDGSCLHREMVRGSFDRSLELGSELGRRLLRGFPT